MKITNHKLVAESGNVAVKQMETPNQTPNQILDPKYLIIHYTAGSSFESSVSWLMNKDAKASAHLVIGRDGKIAQLGAFNKKLWHAGVSRWANLIGMNNYSIGIELDNSGRLKKVGNSWVDVAGRKVADADIVFAKHKHEDSESAWHNYPEKQLESLKIVASAIVKQYNIIDILGHDDIAPFRKSDPGPAFGMTSFNSHILGRQDDTGDVFKVISEGTNFRSMPQIDSNNIIGKLKKDTKVEFISSSNGWFQVFIASASSTLKERIGWIHNSVLKK